MIVMVAVLEVEKISAGNPIFVMLVHVVLVRKKEQPFGIYKSKTQMYRNCV